MMKRKVSILKKSIDAVRRHRQLHRARRRRLGVPVVALVGYTNAGKSSLLNALSPLKNTASSPIFAADMLFATLDPTTRMVNVPGVRHPDMLMTDTVGFVQRLPTHLVAAFRATLEEVAEADLLVHVADVTTDNWRKQEAAVLRELQAMGLSHPHPNPNPSPSPRPSPSPNPYPNANPNPNRKVCVTSGW